MRPGKPIGQPGGAQGDGAIAGQDRGARGAAAQPAGVDVEIPRYKLVVLTGVSGSGKSSLAFDTIYAEASAATWRASRPTCASTWRRSRSQRWTI